MRFASLIELNIKSIICTIEDFQLCDGAFNRFNHIDSIAFGLFQGMKRGRGARSGGSAKALAIYPAPPASSSWTPRTP